MDKSPQYLSIVFWSCLLQLVFYNFVNTVRSRSLVLWVKGLKFIFNFRMYMFKLCFLSWNIFKKTLNISLNRNQNFTVSYLSDDYNEMANFPNQNKQHYPTIIKFLSNVILNKDTSTASKFVFIGILFTFSTF